MPHIAPVSWRRFERFLSKAGCKYLRQKGSHRSFSKPGLVRPIVLPIHGDVPIGIIRTNLRTLGISVEEYLDLLKDC